MSQNNPKIMKRFIKVFLTIYQRVISPLLGPRCQYYPSCSHYMKEAIEIHGVVLGLYYGLKRLLRCHPFCEAGHDPVPPKKSISVKKGI